MVNSDGGVSQTSLPTEMQTELSPDRLAHLYHDKELTVREIGERVGLAHSTVVDKLAKHGIERREWPRKSLVVPLRTDHEGYERWRHQFRDDDGKKRENTVGVHRLAAAAWLGVSAINESTVVHHINGVPWDNRESNLAVMSPTGHTQHHNAE